ncbi:MAG: hypothetical protein K6G58_08690 [Lachnospiraceae bacterium]|nr:hypothetical protein [Lachnospiraceae bacterium]
MGNDNKKKFLNALGSFRRENTMKEAVRKAENLIGADDLKEFVERSSLLYKHSAECDAVIVSAISRMYILSVNSGDGICTQLDILTDVLRAMGDVENLGVQYFALNLPDHSIRKLDSEAKTDRDIILEDIKDMGLLKVDKRRICCIDISRWIDRIESAEFRAVLARLRDRMYDQFVVFWIPAVDELTLRRVHEAIEWFVNVDDIYTPPFSVDQYYEYGINKLEKMNVRLDEGAREVFRNCIVSRRTDKNFFGFNTINNLMNEMIFTTLMEGEP